jgi:hypothetical protein
MPVRTSGICSGVLLGLQLKVMTMKFNKYQICALVAAAFAGSAAAELPPAATAAMGSLETDAGSMLDAGWPIAVAVVGGLLLLKLFKKVTGKAT